jgi:hypothetical protein
MPGPQPVQRDAGLLLHSPWINAMKRCVLLLAAMLMASVSAHAQRIFSANALRGELVVKAPPEALLNGKPVRLAPGSRIRNGQNMIQVSASVLEQRLVVNYTLDGFGQVHDVWILTEEEARRQPWPRTLEEAREWRFDPTLQRWAKP